MYAPDFAYYRAGSVAEVGRLLRKHPGAKLLAGGHSLIPLLKLRLAAPPALIDIGRLDELKGISVADGQVRIGALTTHAQLASSSELAGHAPALAEAASLIGDPAVRNRGTIGGNVAHADPASDLPTVLRALDASISVTTDTGERSIPAGDFFEGMMTTALGEHDLVTAIAVPSAANGQGQAYEKFSHPASRYAVVGAAATVVLKGGRVERVAVTLGGLVPAATRAGSVEQALAGKEPSAEAIATAAAAVSADLGDDLIGDIYASAAYRRAMAPVCVKRALTAALGRAESHEDSAEDAGTSGASTAGTSANSAEPPVPTARRPVPTARRPVPTTQPPVPTARRSVPTTQPPVPTARRSVPTARRSVPTTQPPVPTARRSVPTARRSVPTARRSVPTARRPVPTARRPVPTTQPPVPTARRSVPPALIPQRPVRTPQPPLLVAGPPVMTTRGPMPRTHRPPLTPRRPRVRGGNGGSSP